MNRTFYFIHALITTVTWTFGIVICTVAHWNPNTIAWIEPNTHETTTQLPTIKPGLITLHLGASRTNNLILTYLTELHLDAILTSKSTDTISIACVQGNPFKATPCTAIPALSWLAPSSITFFQRLNRIRHTWDLNKTMHWAPSECERTLLTYNKQRHTNFSYLIVTAPSK